MTIRIYVQIMTTSEEAEVGHAIEMLESLLRSLRGNSKAKIIRAATDMVSGSLRLDISDNRNLADVSIPKSDFN